MDQQWQQDTMGKKKTWKLKKEIEALCSLKVEQSYCLFSASTSFSLLPLFPPFVLPPQISFSALWFWLSSFYHTHSSPTSHFISFSFLLSVSGSLNVSSDVFLAYFSPLITLFPSFYSLCQSSHLLCPPSNTHTHMHCFLSTLAFCIILMCTVSFFLSLHKLEFTLGDQWEVNRESNSSILT